MKRMICVILTLLLTALPLVACRSADTQAPSSLPTTFSATAAVDSQPAPSTTGLLETTAPTKPEEIGVPVPCSIGYRYDTSLWMPEDVKWPIVIKSSEQLYDLLVSWERPYHFQTTVRNKIMEIFNDAFFTRNTLVLACIRADPGYMRCELLECLEMGDGSYCITLKEGEPGFHEDFNIFVYPFLIIPLDLPANTAVTISLVESEHMQVVEQS